MTLDKCIVLRIGTLTRCTLCRKSHPLCRLKNPTVISIWLLVGFHPAARSVQSTPADNTRKSIIKCEDSVKLLGVTIDYLLNFDLHVSNICKKAARQIYVLLCLSKFLTIETKILIYKSFIRSSFNFCPLVWHFCSKTSSAKMEKLQYRALRLVFNDFDSSYETLLERVNMPTLHISRIRLIAVETFKILHKMSPVYLQDLLSKQKFYLLFQI